jgi:hypothetical protein
LLRLHIDEVQRPRWEAVATESPQDLGINPAEVGEASLNVVGDPVSRDQFDQELIPRAETVEVLDAPLKAIGRGNIMRAVERVCCERRRPCPGGSFRLRGRADLRAYEAEG